MFARRCDDRFFAAQCDFGQSVGRSCVAGRRLPLFAVHNLVVAPHGEGSVTPAMPPRAPIILVVGSPLGAAVFVNQRLPVGDRDLVVIRMNFAKSEETMAVAAIIDERGLQ